MNLPANPEPRPLHVAVAAACVVLGILAGTGAFTFHYAEGTSYFSADPRACANCHIMNPQYDGWQKAPHHVAATCVDCHLPATFIRKYLAKAQNGWAHSRGFTLQDFPEPIRITPGNADILQENCVRCHATTVAQMAGTEHGGGRQGISCVHCHLDVGHGQRALMGRVKD